MLRRLVALTVLLFACALAQAQQLAAIPPLTGPVIDTTATLDAATKERLEAQALALQQRKGSQLQVLVIPTTQPEDIAQYATRAYDQYKLGRTGTNDGLLLVVAKDDRRARIEVGYGLEGAIPDATAIRVITEYMTPKFRAGDFNGGLTDATGVLVKLIDGETLPPPLVEQRRPRGGRGGGFLFALFAALIVAQVARAFLSPVPSVVRGVLGAVAAGGVAWLLSSVLVGGIGALIGFFVGLAGVSPGSYARHGGWGGFGGGGGWGGGGFGGGGGGFGGGGGGWSGGGGMSGGGGASGSW
ncbi:uncharacterized protein J2X04_000258 [Lysobacter niabensis]|uniref:TPM domain-containing protein n=1 Tax=Agrilutibacter niabensis TaxID=380628 RepID=A0ABU1VKC2_9GAMM|nr:TPM domain-containing protein [Lysobacter niabensis]MDR7097911.1 uncharacterized protein [Lysobacter niabensis]